MFDKKRVGAILQDERLDKGHIMGVRGFLYFDFSFESRNMLKAGNFTRKDMREYASTAAGDPNRPNNPAGPTYVYTWRN
jgi:hypothetical protein